MDEQSKRVVKAAEEFSAALSKMYYNNTPTDDRPQVGQVIKMEE